MVASSGSKDQEMEHKEHKETFDFICDVWKEKLCPPCVFKASQFSDLFPEFSKIKSTRCVCVCWFFFPGGALYDF